MVTEPNGRQGKGFPGGSGVKNLPANAGDTGSIPDPGKSHLPPTEKLRPCATTAEPVLQEPQSCNFGATVLQLRKPKCPRTHAPQQEKPLQ